MFLLFELPIEQLFIHIKNILWDAFGKYSQVPKLPKIDFLKIISNGLYSVIQTYPNDPASPKTY